MNIKVYSKPGCGKCAAAKSKLQLMGFDYTEHDLAYHITLHDGWRQDGSADVMAAHTMLDTLPIFRLDDEFHDYPSAMRKLKDVKTDRPAAAV
ncbi:MAG: glutaredoxin [Planctomycetota bacterium]|nr:glutaredoxin [Planctomycetota bacterium]